MESLATFFVLLLSLWTHTVDSAHSHFVTPDQKSGMLGSLSSPAFANAASPQRVAVVDNGLLSPQRTLASLSSLSGFESVIDTGPQISEQSSAHAQNQIQEQYFNQQQHQQQQQQLQQQRQQNQQQQELGQQVIQDSYQETQNQRLANMKNNEMYRHVAINNNAEPAQTENKIIVQGIQTEGLKNTPTRKNSLSDQIDLTKQERAFTIDQPTVKKAVSRQKIKKGEAKISTVEKTSKKATKNFNSKSVIFRSGDTVFRPGQKSASYRFTGTSFTRPKPTPEPPVTKPDIKTTQMMEELTTTFKNSILGGYFTTESPVTMWKQSIETGLYETTKGFSVPIKLNTVPPTKPPKNNKYSFVNPTDGAVIGGHIVTEEKPVADIIVNHHKTSVSDRNKMFDRLHYQNANWNQNQRQHSSHHNKLSSSLSNAKIPQNYMGQQPSFASTVKPTKTAPESAHVVSESKTVSDIIIGGSQQGSLSMNTEPILSKSGKHFHANSQRNFHQRMPEVNMQPTKEEPIREIVDFKNNGMGLGMGSLSNPRNMETNINNWNEKPAAPQNMHGRWIGGNHAEHQMLTPSHQSQSHHPHPTSYLQNPQPIEMQNTNIAHHPNAMHAQQNREALQHGHSQFLKNDYSQRKRRQRKNHKSLGQGQSQIQTDSNFNPTKHSSVGNQLKHHRPATTKQNNVQHRHGIQNTRSHSQGNVSPNHTLNGRLTNPQQENQQRHVVSRQQNTQRSEQPNQPYANAMSNPNAQPIEPIIVQNNGHVVESEPINQQQKYIPQHNQQNVEPINQNGYVLSNNNQLGNPQAQYQIQMRGTENVPYNLVNNPPYPAEYFQNPIEYIPEPGSVRSVQKLSHKMNNAPSNIDNSFPSGQRWKSKETNRMTNPVYQLDAMSKSAQNMLQVDIGNTMFTPQGQQIVQSNSINEVSPKLNPTNYMDASFNMPREIINNPNIQMLNVENPRHSQFSIPKTNILYIKPINGLSPDIVQISELESNIPIIEIPISYNYIETTTVPVLNHQQNLHTTSSLAAKTAAPQTGFTKAPEVFSTSLISCKILFCK